MKMKNKGISLIVLVVTIIVIIILAGAVILSLTQNNPINEATQAAFKFELKSLDEQVLLSISKEFFKDNNIMDKKITDSATLYRLIPSLKENKHDGKVYISNGKLTINATKYTKEQIKWAIEAQIQVGDLPVVKGLELTSTETTITANVTMENTSEIIGYMYKITGPKIEEKWVDSINNTYIFENLKIGTEYIVEVKAKTSELESVSKLETILTKGVNELVVITPNTAAWINGNVTITLSHSSVPAGYELQYKIGAGTWTKYTSVLTQTTNETVYGRIYNTILDDEIGANSYDVTNIDKTAPSIPTDITVVRSDINSITVQAVGSTDSQSGMAGYEYSINGGAYTEALIGNQVFSGIKAGTLVTIKARAKDNVGLYSSEKTITPTTGVVSGNVVITPNITNWINGNVTITLSHSSVPAGYELQYKIGAGAWTKYTSVLTQTTNTTVYGRIYNALLDDEIGANSYDVTNIDKTAPVNANISISNNNIEQNKSTNVTIIQNDNLSGIDIKKCKWVVNTTVGNIGTNESSYTGGTFTSVSQTITVNQSVVGTYYVHVLSVDKVGNKIETVSSGIKVVVPTVASKVKPGDYISYTPTITSYTSPSSLNGESSNQVFNPSSYAGGWRVLTNTGGTVTLVSAGSVGNLTLAGTQGYVNAVAVLNELCSQYVNPTYATSGRSIGTTSASIGSVNLSQVIYGNSSTMDTYYENDINALNSAGIRFNTNIRLGSRDVIVNSDYYSFGVRYISSDGGVNHTGLYVPSSGDLYYGYITYSGVAAVVSLKSNLKVTGGDGTVGSPYQLGL